MPERIGVTELGVYLMKRQALHCSCGHGRTMAYWEPPNKVVIRTRLHDVWHTLTLVIGEPAPGLFRAEETSLHERSLL